MAFRVTERGVSGIANEREQKKMAKGDVTEVGPPIDSARLWWFIKHHHPAHLSSEYAMGYNKALDDLATWLSGAGY